MRMVLAGAFGVLAVLTLRELVGWDVPEIVLVPLLVPTVAVAVVGAAVVDSWGRARRSGSKQLLLRSSFGATVILRATVRDALAAATEIAADYTDVTMVTDDTSFVVTLCSGPSTLSAGELMTMVGRSVGTETEIRLLSQPLFRRNMIDGGRNYENVLELASQFGSRLPARTADGLLPRSRRLRVRHE